MINILLENISLYYPSNIRNISLRKKIINTTFGKNIKDNRIEALSNINLQLNEGVYGLYGENGSGKTSLLKILAKIYEPTIGNVSITGTVASLINIHFGFSEELTGLENIELKLILSEVPYKDIENLSKIIAVDCDLEEYLKLPLKTYSSGMRFRLAFFIAKYINSDILLMDEWIETGDEKLRDIVDNIINEKISKSKITIIASHNLERLKKICTKIFYLKNGRISNN
jgi:ABC-type polysaccharide/polyol phosphate transport system ATPase subunit